MLAPLQFIQELFFGSLSSLIGGIGEFASVLGMDGIATGLAGWSEGIENFSETAAAAIATAEKHLLLLR